MTRAVLFALGTTLVACGARSAHAVEPALEPHVASVAWYRATTTCAQGPFELAVQAGDDRWGEDVELQVHAPHGVFLQAMARIDGTVADGSSGTYGGIVDNARCLATVQEQVAAARAGDEAANAPAGATSPTSAPSPPVATAPVALVPASGELSATATLLHVHLAAGAHQRVTLQLWSIRPNDLDGVAFGAAHVAWRPNVSDAAYLAFEQRRADAAAHAAAADAAAREAAAVHVGVVVADPAAAARARAELDAREAEAARRRAIEAELDADRARRRQQFCDAHRDDADCWGAGGYREHAELDRRARERDVYCAGHATDARCWTPATWQARRAAWGARVDAAVTAANRQPDGPPPAPLAETPPPRLSLHAEWRPGYYQWLGGTWVWLAGQWRVPDADVAAELTTTAPAAPPPLRVEPPTVAPARATVWIAGFWQWSGASWIWVPGSWQLRPAGDVAWRTAEWRARGRVHVLVPGAWVPR